jgi:hypothetical protein
METFVTWTTRFILFYGKRPPRDRTCSDVGRFLDHVVRTDKEPLVAGEAARTALDFLYREVLQMDLGKLPRPRPPRLLDQVRQVLRVRHYARRTEECYVQRLFIAIRSGTVSRPIWWNVASISARSSNCWDTSGWRLP